MDVVDAATRSRMMSRIRGVDTRPEIAIRRGLHAEGFRFVLHDQRLPGRPDIVLPKWKAVVMVNGCFWHAHQGCSNFRIPATRTDFWTRKLLRNAERDAENVDALEALGWRVAIVWECAVRAGDPATVQTLSEWLRTGTGRYETGLTPGG